MVSVTQSRVLSGLRPRVRLLPLRSGECFADLDGPPQPKPHRAVYHRENATSLDSQNRTQTARRGPFLGPR